MPRSPFRERSPPPGIATSQALPWRASFLVILAQRPVRSFEQVSEESHAREQNLAARGKHWSIKTYRAWAITRPLAYSRATIAASRVTEGNSSRNPSSVWPVLRTNSLRREYL